MSATSALQAIQQLHRAGRLAEAEAGYRRLLAENPENAEVWHLLGVLACQRGHAGDAVKLIGAAIERDGTRSAYHVNLAVALQALNRSEKALAALHRARALAPEDTAVAFNIGALLQRLDRHAEAAPFYEHVLSRAPHDGDALSNFGLALLKSGQLREAVAILQRAVAVAPEHIEAHTNLGLALLQTGDAGAALDCFARVRAARPDDAGAHLNYGRALYALGRFGDALAAFDKASALAPADAAGHYERANTLRDIGRIGEALAAYDRTLACEPRHVDAWRDRLAALLYAPDVAPDQRFAEHLRFAAAFAPEMRSAPPGPVPDPDRPLRIGYLSSDFRHHPVARNFEPLLAHRDRKRFQVICYADIRRPDEITDRYRSLADGWRDVAGLSDEAVADLIRKDRIDILVLLAGRFDRNRPLVAQHRPAPIQISLHDPATSGLAEIDYILADRHLVPRATAERFSERVLRLPAFYLHVLPEARPNSTRRPGRERPLTFASFCHPAKLNAEVLALWGRILARLPAARLQLHHRRRFGEPDLQDRVLRTLTGAGAGRQQIEFLAEGLARLDHLALYDDVDIALDPFPFSGSTSTFEALSMGIPVVTLESEPMVGRWSLAMLRAASLGQWIAATPEAYVETATDLAQDAQKRAELRRTRPDRIVSSLCDGPQRTRQVERLYRAVWRRWCARRGA